MGKLEKLIARFLTRPKDLTWDELVTILNFYGYTEIPGGKTGGSRRKFCDEEKTILTLHKPHPKPIVKSYVINQILGHLKDRGKLK